jgi:hypothetical protein
MRLWSLHPKYLDTKGLVALWREALLAKKVLAGNTKGYKQHPQLERFKEAENALDSINQYLQSVLEEAIARNYLFDARKIENPHTKNKLTVTKGQLEFERKHLLAKLEKRDPVKHSEIIKINTLLPHPLFEVIEGGVEKWEIV